MSRILIETIVRRTLREIQESPERSTRNLVDMALQFSKGRFQKCFLEGIRRMLENENSAYYTLVHDMVTHVDTERLLNFGMNIGYNSCTLGAEMIREWETKSGYNVPWAVFFEFDRYSFQKYPNRYHCVIAEGEEMGIFTWLLFTEDKTQDALRLVEDYPDSAFFLFCNAEVVTEEFIDEVSVLDNVMLLIQFSEKADEVCSRLRQEKLLYGIYYSYTEADVADIANGDLFYSTQQLHPVATVLINAPDCPKSIQKQVSQLVQAARNSQKYQTLAWEVYGDNCSVDEIISEDVCFVHFDKDGNLCDLNIDEHIEKNNLFDNSLQKILMQSFPKE